MKQTGHNSFRVSISWARMFPADGVGEVNPKAIEFYRDLFTEMKDNGIKVFANLYHFDMPAALQDKGGWESRRSWMRMYISRIRVLKNLAIWFIIGLPSMNRWGQF